MTFSLSVVLSQCIEGVIGGTDYNQSKVNQWTASIVEHALTHLVKQGRPFKYIGEPPVHHILKHDTSGHTVDMWSICVTLLLDVSQWTVPSCRRAVQGSTQLTPATGTLPLMVRDILLKLLYQSQNSTFYSYIIINMIWKRFYNLIREAQILKCYIFLNTSSHTTS